MKDKVQLAAIIALSIVGLAAIDAARTAILTGYAGSFGAEAGLSGGQIRVVGRSDAGSNLPPAD